MSEFPEIPFHELNEVDDRNRRMIDQIVRKLREDGFDLYPESEAVFKNKDFFEALPEAIRTSNDLLGEYIKNNALFASIISKERSRRWEGKTDGFFAEEVAATSGVHADGRERRAESGYKLNIEYLKLLGIDPNKVLFYRRTQLGQAEKPELYWTSDFREVLSGLTAEISGELRKSSIVLACDIAALDQIGGGLIQDINDDGGVSVRMIEPNAMDQNVALFAVQNPSLLKIHSNL